MKYKLLLLLPLLLLMLPAVMSASQGEFSFMKVATETTTDKQLGPVIYSNYNMTRVVVGLFDDMYLSSYSQECLVINFTTNSSNEIISPQILYNISPTIYETNISCDYGAIVFPSNQYYWFGFGLYNFNQTTFINGTTAQRDSTGYSPSVYYDYAPLGVGTYNTSYSPSFAFAGSYYFENGSIRPNYIYPYDSTNTTSLAIPFSRTWAQFGVRSIYSSITGENQALNITARSNLTGANISAFAANLHNREQFSKSGSTIYYNGTYARSNSTTTYNLTLPTSINESYALRLTASGYWPKDVTWQSAFASPNETFYLTQIGGQNIRFATLSTNQTLATAANITFQNSTTSLNYTFTGTGNVSTLSVGTYNVFCQAPGYSNVTLVWEYDQTTAEQILTCYMPVSATPVVFQLQGPDFTPLANVLVNVQQFINGTYVDIASRYTELTGLTTINLISGVSTKITMSKTGYVTATDITTLEDSTYTYTLDEVNRYDQSNNAGSNISYWFTPTALDLNLSVHTFTLNVTPTDVSLNYLRIEIQDFQGNSITSLTNDSSTGAEISIDLNTTPYNGSYIRVIYSFEKEDFTEFSTTQIYNIRDTQYTGSVAQARDYLEANFTLGERIFLWMFSTIFVALMAALFGIRGISNIFVSSAVWYGLAWVFAMNMFIVGLILFILMLASVRYSL